jgi:outer membrane protein assembly factor BamB
MLEIGDSGPIGGTTMKRLAAIAVAGGLAAATASAQYARVYTRPTPPPTEVLDRLNLRLGWRTAVPTAGYRDGIATIQHLGDLVIVQTVSGSITAIDPVTGAAKWRASVGLPYPVAHRVGYNDSLILVTNGTRIYALDRATGAGLWDVDLAGTPSSPPTADVDAFYVCLSNGRLSAYAFPVTPPPAVPGTPTAGSTAGAGRPAEPPPPLRSGAATASTPGIRHTPPVPARPSAGGVTPATTEPNRAPTAGGGRTVTVSGAINTRSASTAVQATGGRTATGGEGIEINRSGRGPVNTGGGPKLLWDYQSNLRVSERPVLGEKTMFVEGSGRDGLFINKDGDKPLVFTADAAFSAPLGQYGDIVYAACANGTVYALNLTTRVMLWQVTVNGPVTEQPIVTDQDLFVTSEYGGVIRAVRANGQMIWQNPAAVHFVAANPKFVYATDRTGQLLILDAARGTTLTRTDTRDFTVIMPNRLTDRIVLAGSDGTVVSLHDRAYAEPLRLNNPPAVAPPPPAPTPATPPAPAEPPASPPANPPRPATPPPGNRPATPPRPAPGTPKPPKPEAPPAPMPPNP